MKEPVWLLKQAVLAIHAESLQLHGGSDGLRDEGALDAALARPRHRSHYESADLCRLATSYALGIAKNHPFVDGNKRTAFLAMTVFLERNGLRFDAPAAHAAVFMIGVADGSLTEEGLADWLRDSTSRMTRVRKAKKSTTSRKAPRRR